MFGRNKSKATSSRKGMGVMSKLEESKSGDGDSKEEEDEGGKEDGWEYSGSMREYSGSMREYSGSSKEWPNMEWSSIREEGGSKDWFSTVGASGSSSCGFKDSKSKKKMPK